MTAYRNTFSLFLLGAAATAVLAPYAADSGTCANDAARNLLVASYVDTVLNPATGEDLEFLVKDSGIPNIMILFDSSLSMRLLPPDGPGKIGGPTSTKPPAGIVGCGRDAVSLGTPSWIDSGTIQGIKARTFHPPCGRATDPTLLSPPATYRGHTTDYAAAMTVCPYFTSSNNQATGAAGYDPDFYGNAGPTDTSQNGNPVFFARDLVFHDAALNGTASFTNPTRDGWTDTAVYPWMRANNAVGSIAEFCAAQGATLQGTRTLADICNECMSTEGWYYDGTTDSTGYEGTYPSLWYTGNYLNFFPPKFLAARKVVKDIIAVQSKVRMALAAFDSNGATVFKDFNPSCGMPDGSNFDSNRAAYVSGLNSSGSLSFDAMTPLAEALFDVGRYYHSPALPWFGSAWEDSTKESASNANQYAVCASCQASTVIILTDGVPNDNDGNGLPPNTVTQAQLNAGVYAGDPATGIKRIGTGGSPLCTVCSDFTGTDDYLNNLPRVAWYLQNTDLRQNNETTLDCKGMGGVQRLQTYTVGFATAQNPNANKILQNTATAGNGVFVGAEDPSQLKDGINYIMQEISTRSTSFSVATISTLQTTAGRAVIVPRFDPNKTAHWKGHLFRFDLYSEFVNACTPNGVGDLDCDGQCVSTFLNDDSGTDDATASLVGEDGNGSFVRNDPATQPICAQAPGCVASGKCSVPGNAAAVPFWDAGAQLMAQSWRTRNVYTVVDGDGDGRINGADPAFPIDATIRLDTSDASATAIAPYLGLGTNAAGSSVCSALSSRLSAAGDTASAARVMPPPPPAIATAAQIATAKMECAKTIIRYVLGADVFNDKAVLAPAWPPANEDLLWDRSYKLGDIFHSSPQVVDPPFPRLGILCKDGLTTQCKKGLWATPTLGGETGYDGYALSAEFQFRDKLVLVGANDGLLHAFNGGTWIANPTPGVHYAPADDPFTSKVDESLPPFNGHYTRGTANEVWAFVPPDLLSKLPLLTGSAHQFYVDGDPWVQDVWVDGTDNRIAGAPSPAVNDRKEAREFHTVAVVGERRGGTRFFALDITSATQAGQAPKFLWVYPQPNDPESLTFGETYNSTLPSPSPIVPLRIAATSADLVPNVTPSDTFTVAGVATTVSYHERWVAWLNGGFDEQYVRGRGVHAVDVWTGKELFDFSYPLDPTSVPAGDPRLNLRFPIPAAVGNMAWGPTAFQASQADPGHHYLFDTATFGDAGGQTWVVRYFTPGALDATGHVTNWYGARAFQMGGQVPCALCAAQPIFYITNNIFLPTARSYRVGFGTGDRFNLLDKLGGTCGPDNIRACVMRGCTVTLDPAFNRMEATGLGFVQQGLSQVACSAITDTQSTGGTATCTVNGSAKIAITACPGGLATTKFMGASCTEYADGYKCDTTSTTGGPVAIDDTRYPITLGNMFASLLVFSPSGPRSIFTSAPEAKTYDDARLWFSQTGASAYTVSPGVVVRSFADNTVGTPAAEDGPGWILYYGHGPQVTVDYHVFTVDWRDERTSSTGAVGTGLMTWYATQPTIADVTTTTTSSCRASKCTAESRRLSYHYGADPGTGQPVLKDSTGALVRTIANYVQVPSQGDQKTVFVNQLGQVATGLTSVSPEKGATNVGMSDPVDPTSDVGFLDVDEELHACRHVAANPTCK